MPNQADWTNRIVGSDVKPAAWFLANSSNYRIHPLFQQEALIAILDKIGWVQRVVVNLRTSELWPPNERGIETLVDGHMRVEISLSKGDDTPVPLEYVDLTPDEEALILALLDPISGWAATDKQKLDELIHSIQISDAKLDQALAALAQENDIDYGAPAAGAGTPAGTGSHNLTCPYCGMEFEPGKSE